MSFDEQQAVPKNTQTKTPKPSKIRSPNIRLAFSYKYTETGMFLVSKCSVMYTFYLACMHTASIGCKWPKKQHIHLDIFDSSSLQIDDHFTFICTELI